MSDFINISIIQSDTVWEDKESNMRRAEELLEKVPFAQDMIIFPEMFLTGFSMNVPTISEPMDGKMVKWMQNTSKRLNSNILGSLPIVDNGKNYNRLVISSPDNQIFWYDKKHLFRMGEEQHHFSGGKSRLIYNWGQWSILPLVCYDLRFPVWSRNKNLEYNILLYVANWPAVRNDAFLSLLKARAIENSSYVIGVNRVGIDGNKIEYRGNSVVYGPKGNVLAGMIESEETVINIPLSLSELNNYRIKFPVHLDGDDFNIQ